MKILRYFAAFLLLSGAAFAQAGWYGSVAQGMTYTNGIRVEQPLPGSQILVCTAVSTCDLVHAATIYTSSAGTTVAQNPFTADNQGNFGFWALPGNYQYTFTYKGNAYGPFMVTIGANDGNVVHQNGNETITGDKTFTGNTTFSGPVNITGGLISSTFTGNLIGNVTGDVLSSGTSTFKNLNAVRYCDQFAGADAGAKIMAAYNDLPSTGGVIDCRGFGITPQTISTQLLLGEPTGTKRLTLIFDTASTFNVTVTGGVDAIKLYPGVSIVGQGHPNSNAGFILSSTANVSSLIKFEKGNTGQSMVTLEGITLKGNAAAVVSSAMLDALNATDVTTIRNTVIWNFANTYGLRLRTDSGNAMGPINIENVTVNGMNLTGAKPVLIESVVGSGIINGINFYGGTYAHPGSGGNAIIDIKGITGGDTMAINFYGILVESQNTTDIGIRITDSSSISAQGISFTANTNPGADCVKIIQSTGVVSGLHFANVRVPNLWTNIINDTINSVTLTTAALGGVLTQYNWIGDTDGVFTYGRSGLVQSQTRNVVTAKKYQAGQYVIDNTPAPAVGANQIGLGSNTATTTGAAGGASALPATPTGYWIVNIGGTNFKIPYYAN